MERPLAGYSLSERWEGDLEGQQVQERGRLGGFPYKEGLLEDTETVQSGEASACARAAGAGSAPEEKHAVCFRDRGRSLEAGGLPGGAICFGGHEGLWHALRALVRTYEYCA